MGQKSEIQWCDSTVNPTTGCDGCELWSKQRRSCYAGPLHEGRLAKSLPKLYAPTFDEVRLAPGRMVKAAAWPDLAGTSRPDKPWLDGMPRVIFVGDMGDVLSGTVPFEYLKSELIDVIASPKGRRHVWMLLTKRPYRLAAFARWHSADNGSAWPTNLWSGTSVTGRNTLSRIDELRAVPGLRFVSFEPLIEDVGAVDLDGIGLAIVGGESDQGETRARRFELEWARNLIRRCNASGTAAFVKQLGSGAIDEANGIAGRSLRVHPDAAGLISSRLKDSHGGDWTEWPLDLRVREFPAMPTPAGLAR